MSFMGVEPERARTKAESPLNFPAERRIMNLDIKYPVGIFTNEGMIAPGSVGFHEFW